MALVKKLFKGYGILGLSVLLFIVMSFANKYFATFNNVTGLMNAMSTYGIVAVGLTYVLICGQLDISIGSVLSLSAIVFANALPTLGFLPSILVTLLAGAVLGAFTGFFVAKLKLNSFIVSMCAQIIYKGIALTISQSKPAKIVDQTVIALGSVKIWIIPLIFLVFIAVVIIFDLILKNTSYGRNLYIIGGNQTAANNLGMNVTGHTWAAFIICGFLSALAGMVLMVRVLSAAGNLALEAPLSVIPMVIIGGTSFSGGRGSVARTFIGVLLINIIYNSMTMFNINPHWQGFVRGMILLLIIVIGRYLENKKFKV